MREQSPNIDKHHDKLLLIIIRRVNYFGIQGSETSNYIKHRLNLIKEMKVIHLVELSYNYQPLGPFPEEKYFELWSEIKTMIRSLGVGNKVIKHVRFDTIRKYRYILVVYRDL